MAGASEKGTKYRVRSWRFLIRIRVPSIPLYFVLLSSFIIVNEIYDELTVPR